MAKNSLPKSISIDNLEFAPLPRGNFRDITGLTMNRWIVLGYAGHRRWWCQCTCGTIKTMMGYTVAHGTSKSCGCFNREVARLRFQTHAMSKTRVYRIWAGMLTRCHNSKARHYSQYGGRGITVCERWRHFELFFADMGKPPTHRHSIERKSNNGHYEPSNCIWATNTQQANNRRSNQYWNYQDKRLSIAEWCRECGVTPSCFYGRRKRGWTMEQALNLEFRRPRSRHV